MMTVMARLYIASRIALTAAVFFNSAYSPLMVNVIVTLSRYSEGIW